MNALASIALPLTSYLIDLIGEFKQTVWLEVDNSDFKSMKFPSTFIFSIASIPGEASPEHVADN